VFFDLVSGLKLIFSNCASFAPISILLKPTDSDLRLPFSSSHTSHCKQAIPYAVALLIKRNCSTEESLVKRSKEYTGYLKRQYYNAVAVDAQYGKDFSIERSDLLKKKKPFLTKRSSRYAKSKLIFAA